MFSIHGLDPSDNNASFGHYDSQKYPHISESPPRESLRTTIVNFMWNKRKITVIFLTYMVSLNGFLHGLSLMKC